MVIKPDVYEDRLLAFIDILGFSRLIDASISDREIAQKLLDLFNGLSKLFRSFRSDDFAITAFSDTLCISSRNPASIVPFCCGLSVVATSLLGLSYPVRGAVSRGLLYHREDTIFGPCMVRAYKIESRLAIFPRIVIDPIITHMELTSDEAQLEPFYICEDGLCCVNFLSPVLLRVSFRLLGLPAETLLSEIVANVDSLYRGTSDEAALQKLNWLRAYVQRTMSGNPPPEDLIARLAREALHTVKPGSA